MYVRACACACVRVLFFRTDLWYSDTSIHDLVRMFTVCKTIKTSHIFSTF